MIKKLLVLSLLFLLVGCSERELEFDRAYPDSSKYNMLKTKKEARQAAQAEEIARENSGFTFLADSSFKPVVILINQGHVIKPSNYCWKATYEECANLKYVEVFNDRILRIYNLNYFTFKANSKLTLSYNNISSIIKNMPIPDNLEIYTFNEDSTLTPYPSKKINENQYEITLPSEITTYNFVFKTIYKTNIGGVSYYSLQITLE